MLGGFAQRWSTINALQASGLEFDDIVAAYISVTGRADALDVRQYLDGVVMLPERERDLLTQTINELIDCADLTIGGAYYSDDDALLVPDYIGHLDSLTLDASDDDFLGTPAIEEHHASAQDFL
ncbi:hypothetical protein FDK12_14095 [Arthrobacter sp. NamB2]|uniref:hypothetical protein n=1 Tax=Arthrobacter sp. NamB2 TaxID=2576035 RepID=UPI0010C9B16C|nr:hypothetical protein [Arthrobacter sp. NamB2]TKV26496.1 hypothetical protein FDK12_14095 [Arthrobacter sp. NamB2]